MTNFHRAREKAAHFDDSMCYAADARGDMSSPPFAAAGIQACLRFFMERWPYRHKIDISPAQLRILVEQCGAKPFHNIAINNRIWRRHVCIACGWIADYFPRDVSIFEPGCGAGANLLWLASHGFRHVNGADIDDTALKLCRAMQNTLGFFFPVFQDDGMRPRHPETKQDIILSVNWLYHIPQATLGIFFEKYLPHLKKHGVVICDIIDSAYNHEKNNIYHTQDGKKPVHERRASEYTFRMSHQEVLETAARYGLRILRHARVYAIPQRKVYMLSR